MLRLRLQGLVMPAQPGWHRAESCFRQPPCCTGAGCSAMLPREQPCTPRSWVYGPVSLELGTRPHVPRAGCPLRTLGSETHGHTPMNLGAWMRGGGCTTPCPKSWVPRWWWGWGHGHPPPELGATLTTAARAAPWLGGDIGQSWRRRQHRWRPRGSGQHPERCW